MTIRQAFVSVCQIAQVGLFALIAGCTPPAQIIKPTTVEVPKYIRTPIPPALVQPTVYVEPAPACGSVFCNGQLLTMRQDYRTALDSCNADKATLRELNTSLTKPAAGAGEPASAPAEGQP